MICEWCNSLKRKLKKKKKKKKISRCHLLQ